MLWTEARPSSNISVKTWACGVSSSSNLEAGLTFVEIVGRDGVRRGGSLMDLESVKAMGGPACEASLYVLLWPEKGCQPHLRWLLRVIALPRRQAWERQRDLLRCLRIPARISDRGRLVNQ